MFVQRDGKKHTSMADAPKIYLKKTNKKTTSIIDIEILKEFAIDMN